VACTQQRACNFTRSYNNPPSDDHEHPFIVENSAARNRSLICDFSKSESFAVR
jgi:hypothetical protein